MGAENSGPIAFEAANIAPVLFRNIVIDFDGAGAFSLEPILTILTRAGNPELFTCVHIEVVAFESSPFEALEGPATIGERLACLGERDAPNPRRAVQRGRLAFDVHDARLRLSHSGKIGGNRQIVNVRSRPMADTLF